MSGAEFIVRVSTTREITSLEARSDRAFARHSHDDFAVGLIARGAHRSWSGRGMVEATEGDLITANPGEVHDGIPIGGERSWTMLYLSPRFVGSMVSDISDGRLASREIHTPVLRDVCARRHFEAAYAAPDNVESLLLLFGILLGQTPRSRRRADPIGRARESIDDDPTSAHPLDALAALSGLGRYQTIRAFVRTTGFTPHSYVIQRRLELARRLVLRGTGLTAAALEAGFADQSHFHRVFVARFGFTPGALARAISFKTPPVAPLPSCP